MKPHKNHAKKHSKTNKAGSSPKIFDIARPGQALPGASGRPLIVTDRPIVRDPMVTKPVDDAGSAVETPNVPVPESTPEPRDASSASAEPEAVQHLAKLAVADVQSQQDPATDKAIEPDPSAESLVAPSSEAPARMDSLDSLLSDGTPSSPVSPLNETPERPTDDDSETPLPEAEAYQVHIARNRGHALRVAVIGAVLIIVVAVGCADALLDAGVLTLKSVPHTHFIRQY